MTLLEEFKENWSKQPIIIRILFIVLVIAFIYDMVTGNPLSIFFSTALILLIIAEVVNELFYKKDK